MGWLIVLYLLYITNRVRSQEPTTIIYEKEINVKDNSIGLLRVLQGQEPVDAIYEFCQQNKVDDNFKQSIIDNVCQEIRCNRKNAIVHRLKVSESLWFELPEGVEPADAAHEFVIRHNLDRSVRHAILVHTCKVVQCSRAEPVIWRKTLKYNGDQKFEVTVKEGEEPADAIFQQTKQLGINREARLQILKVAKQERVPMNREHALVYERKINIENNSTHELQVWDDGREPVDVLWQFAQSVSLTEEWDQFMSTVGAELCSQGVCNRDSPIVWSSRVNLDGKVVEIYVLKDSEPIDNIDAVCQHYGLHQGQRESILEHVCKEMPCGRTVPVVYRQSIVGENQTRLGEIEVYENEEAADAVSRFMRTNSELRLDSAQLKNHLFRNVCQHNRRMRCTRAHAVLANLTITDENQRPVGTLLLDDTREPVDIMYDFCKERQLPDEYAKRLMKRICANTANVHCNRLAPLVFGPQPISDPEGGYIGVLEIELWQEPIDAIYKFFARYGLFEKGWDMQFMLGQICPRLAPGSCNRRDAVAFFDESFEIGNAKVGPLVIWQKEDPIDKLYKLRIEWNLTLEAQMIAFRDICASKDVYCNRTQAAIFRRRDINKLDFEKFGNETCLRNVAGWQYLPWWSDYEWITAIIDKLKLEHYQEIVYHPAFGPVVLWIFSFLIWGASIIPFVQTSIKPFPKAFCFSCLLCAAGLFQALILEPFDAIDKAKHNLDGNLPELLVLEDEEPADAVMAWAKLASKDHHPLVREPVHWALIDEACQVVKCSRRRAWEALDMGMMTFHNQVYKIIHYNPRVDPLLRDYCKHLFYEQVEFEWYHKIDNSSISVDTCHESTAKRVCGRLFPPPDNCVRNIAIHVAKEYAVFESKRLDSKSPYTKLELEMDATIEEIYDRYVDIARNLNGMNLCPFSRIDNGTHPIHDRWDIQTGRAFAALDAFKKLEDPETREFTDKPCTPYFNGALCGKHDKQGNLLIEA